MPRQVRREGPLFHQPPPPLDVAHREAEVVSKSSGSNSNASISPKIPSFPRAASWVKMTHICSCRSMHHISGCRSSGPKKARVFAITSMREVYCE